MPNVIFLRLEGPMQSWGDHSRWDVRDTAPEPTKSGVIGLLACACGISSDQEIAALSRSLSIGVRCDRPGYLLEDFHTVISGVLKAGGEVKGQTEDGGSDTVVSRRFYLADASFLVVLMGSPDVVQKCAEAVQRPVWPYFLGRKSYIPSRPIFEGVGEYHSLEDALRSHPRVNESRKPVRCVVECSPHDPGAVRRRDEILSRSKRLYLPRYSREFQLPAPNHVEDKPCISLA